MSTIYPMAMIPKPNMTFKLYFLAFPKEWKALMLELQLSINPKFNPLYSMKTDVLYGYLNGWLDDVVQIRPMKRDVEDNHWLVSMTKPDTEKICEILQIWVAAEYLHRPKASEETKVLAERLIAMIEPEILNAGIRSEESKLFDTDGHALAEHAFNAFALYAANALSGKTITVSGQELTFSSCGARELMSQPISDGKKKPHYYAIGLQLSLQTTPPERTCMLLVNCIVKRFVSNVWKDSIYLNENIHSYVYMGNSKYRRITLKQKTEEKDDQKTYHRFWNKSEQQFYDLYNLQPLPDAEKVLRHPEQYLSRDESVQILLPFKNGMDFTDTGKKIGTGVPVKDKASIFPQLCGLMQDFAEPVEESFSFQAIHVQPPQNTPKAEKQKQHRERLKSCTGMNSLQIEIFGHGTDASLFETIVQDLEDYLGGAEYDDIIPVRIVFRELGELDIMMEDDSYKAHCKRIRKVAGHVPESAEIQGAFIILSNTKGEKGDPKKALRAGFADVNRLTQFITPEGEKSRIHGAVMDLLRQFGYSEFWENRNSQKNTAFQCDAVGLHVMKQLEPLYGTGFMDRAKFLPVYVTYQMQTGKLYADCELFDRRHLSYPEALLALSKVSRTSDFTASCNDAARSGFRTKLLGLQSLYREKPALVLVKADGTTRTLWHGITDKKIAEYKMLDAYIPETVDIGTRQLEDKKNFNGTGIRIMRIRDNHGTHEVPDYYTMLNDKDEYESASGLFRYKKVFWGLECRPYNTEYVNSFKQSRIECPNKSYDECGLAELYPIQLQQEDVVEEWIQYANALREVMPETSRKAVRLPAPLHFALLMEEYLMVK